MRWSATTAPDRRRPWLGLLLAGLLLVLLSWGDQYLKQAPHAGYLPDDCDWQVGAPDFPGFLATFAQSSAGNVLAETWPRPVQEVQLWTRLETGVRPTPTRWRVWLGTGLLAGERDGALGLSVRPGVLVHALHTVNRLRASPTEDGIYRYRDFFYALREGFLVASKDPAFVRAALTAPPTYHPAGMAHDELRAEWRREPAGHLYLGGSEGLRVSGVVDWPVTARTRPLTLGGAWPEPPVASITAARFGDVWAVFERLAGGTARLAHARGAAALSETAHRLYTQAAAAWPLDALPPHWEAPSDECAAGFFGFDFSEPLPIPELALILRAHGRPEQPHPLGPLAKGPETRLYAWNGAPGCMRPWLGEKLSLCLADAGQDWVAASRPSLMGRLAGRIGPGGGVRADVMAEADWARVADTLGQLARRAAAYELLPGRGARDVQHELLPSLHALGQMGRLQLEGAHRRGRLEFRGHLALGAGIDAP